MATSLLAGHDATTPETPSCPSSGPTIAQAYAVQEEVGRLRGRRGERIMGYAEVTMMITRKWKPVRSPF
jgi:hypothetical protein